MEEIFFVKSLRGDVRKWELYEFCSREVVVVSWLWFFYFEGFLVGSGVGFFYFRGLLGRICWIFRAFGWRVGWRDRFYFIFWDCGGKDLGFLVLDAVSFLFVDTGDVIFYF